jgi:hypothetical protein
MNAFDVAPCAPAGVADKRRILSLKRRFVDFGSKGRQQGVSTRSGFRLDRSSDVGRECFSPPHGVASNPTHGCSALTIDEAFVGQPGWPCHETALGHPHCFRMGISDSADQILEVPPPNLMPNGLNDEAAPVAIELVDRVKETRRNRDGDSSTRCHNASPSQRRRFGKVAPIQASTNSWNSVACGTISFASDSVAT